jgi:adenylosuccinate synthase
LDKASEEAKGKSKIGSTLRGIGPTYMDKTGRNGLRVGDLVRPDWHDRYLKLRDKHTKMLRQLYGVEYKDDPLEEEWLETTELIRSLQLVDSEYWLDKAIQAGKKILAEGAQGSLLDVDFGTYPFVTSSNTISSAVCNGLGVSPAVIKEVYGISKAYCTRVGGGPFPTQLDDEMGEKLRKAGGEFGATTGRPRRCGWIDLPALRYTVMLSGVSKLIITKVDVMNEFESFKACVAYKVEGEETEQVPFDMVDCDIEPVYKEFAGWNTAIEHAADFSQLPKELNQYLDFLSDYLNTEICMISNGPEREKLINR